MLLSKSPVVFIAGIGEFESGKRLWALIYVSVFKCKLRYRFLSKMNEGNLPKLPRNLLGAYP